MRTRVELPGALKVQRWPRRTRSKAECLRAGVWLWMSCLALGPDETFKCYAVARNGKRDFWDALRGLVMVDRALVRNLRQARRSR